MAWTAPFTFVAAATLTAAKLNEQIRDNWDAAFPVGSLHWRMQSATSVETAVDGFGLECNGVAVSRTTYADLQTKLSGLSYPFGSGNGTTTMNLPSCSGRVLVAMAASGHSSVNALGDVETGGTGTGGLSAANRNMNPTVTDTVSISGSVSGGTVTITNSGGGPGSGGNLATSGTYNLSGATFSDTDVVSDTVDTPYVVPGIVIVKY